MSDKHLIAAGILFVMTFVWAAGISYSLRRIAHSLFDISFALSNYDAKQLVKELREHLERERRKKP